MLSSEGTKTYQWVTGERLKQLGIKYKGEIIPDKMYRIEANGGAQINHFKRMKSYYEQSGIDRVKNYMNEVFSINRGHMGVLQGLQERLSKSI